MKASEVLKQYAAGERNFQRLNLKGQSFKGKDLSRADFSETDIRSANFSGANLQKAKFTNAKCGLGMAAKGLLYVLPLLITAILGFFLIDIATTVSPIFNFSCPENRITAWASWFELFLYVLFVSILDQGIINAVFIFVFSIILGVIFVVSLQPQLQASVTMVNALEIIRAVSYLIAISVLTTILIAATLAVEKRSFLVAVASVSIFIVLGTFAGKGILQGQGAVPKAVPVSGEHGVLFAGAVIIITTLLGIYIGWRAMRDDPRDAWVRSFAIAFAAMGGTSFRDADLTGANFTGAKLKSTDFRKANLTCVRWYGAKMLDRVRPGDTYLKSTQVRQWLLGAGIDKNFDGQKLQGVNFQGADLTDASFIDANLSEASLQEVDLSRAKLVQTQLDGADFTGATLTGAFIEDWGITSSTNLNKVKCEYVFMRLPPEKRPKWLPLPVEESLDLNPRRKPDNWEEVFEGDDFADFIKPIFDTLDLYHNQGVDPRAIAISWKQLEENNPDAELKFSSMEVKGEDNLLLRLKTAPDANLSKLNAKYFDTYNHFKEESKKLLAEKDNRIQALETMVNTALQCPGFYAENYNHQGDNEMAGDHRNIKIDQGNYNEKIEGNYMEGNSYSITGDNNQAVQGDNNQVTQQNRSDTDPREQITKAEVIKLLAELEQKILSSKLPEETKQKTLNRLTTVSDDVQEKEPDKELIIKNFKNVSSTKIREKKG
ncbi:MAG: pentapeptide repeat-containing protein [Waterburya sp.]